MANLAATAALEHFTATLAELVLYDEETRDSFGDPAVRNIFLWHALEESEHKAVAFDVYKAVGGSERMRVWTMNGLRYGFVAGMTFQILISLAFDKETYKKGKLRASWRKFKKSPVVQKQIWEQLKDYNRKDFHPDDSDTDALVEEWRAVLFGTEGTLNRMLVA